MCIGLFNRFVKLAARAFYDDLTADFFGEKQHKTGRSDNRGIAVVVLDALTRRQWVREEDLAKDLKLNAQKLRRLLRFLEEEKLVIREHRKETAKSANIFRAVVAATTNGQQHTKEGEEKMKMQIHSYCCLDYAQMHDVVRYRLHHLKKKLKDELKASHTVEEYVCLDCRKRYNAWDAPHLISNEDEYFHCEICNGVLEVESHKLASQEVGHQDSKSLLQNLEVQLKPLEEQINRVKDLPFPELLNLQASEARAISAHLTEDDESQSIDPSTSSHGLGYCGTPMPFVRDTKVEVAFGGIECKGKDIRSEAEDIDQKVVPPWMIKQEMNLTKGQRGEMKRIVLSQTEIFSYGSSEVSSHQVRQVGMKWKSDEDEADENIDWEENPVAANANTDYKANDLNVEPDDTADDKDNKTGRTVEVPSCFFPLLSYRKW